MESFTKNGPRWAFSSCCVPHAVPVPLTRQGTDCNEVKFRSFSKAYSRWWVKLELDSEGNSDEETRSASGVVGQIVRAF